MLIFWNFCTWHPPNISDLWSALCHYFWEILSYYFKSPCSVLSSSSQMWISHLSVIVPGYSILIFFVLFSSLDSCLGYFYWPMFRPSVQSIEQLLRGILHGCPRVLILSYGFHITPIGSRTLSTISTKALGMLTTVVLKPWLRNLQHLCPIHSYFTPHI